MAALIAWRRWSLGTSARHPHLPHQPSDFPCTLKRKRPKANSGIKDLSPALNKHLQKVYLRLIRKKLGMATSVTTLKDFLPVEELQVLKPHNANILLNPPQSAAPDDTCSSLTLQFFTVLSFLSTFLKLLVYHS